jgi:hypothetical protein
MNVFGQKRKELSFARGHKERPTHDFTVYVPTLQSGGDVYPNRKKRSSIATAR